jgi:choline dehydrogenase-like flavoprotein
MFAYALSLAFLSASAAHYDYIILGGGTCGLVVANRLSEDPNIKVAVVEAGDSVRFNPNVTNTTQFGLALGTSIDWLYQSVPQKYANNKSQVYDAGKALGGTSTINGLSFTISKRSMLILGNVRYDIYPT